MANDNFGAINRGNQYKELKAKCRNITLRNFTHLDRWILAKRWARSSTAESSPYRSIFAVFGTSLFSEDIANVGAMEGVIQRKESEKVLEKYGNR